MTFDDITEDGRLWAVRHEGEADNALYILFDQWSDVEKLRSFFKMNINDLTSYFNITDVNLAIRNTIEESDRLQGIIMDLSPKANLDTLFRPLNNNQVGDMLLGKEKARLKPESTHRSWLRIYALKLSAGIYIITGGAIKLTATMQERQHTNDELKKLERVRQFLIDEHICDNEGFIDYLNELS